MLVSWRVTSCQSSQSKSKSDSPPPSSCGGLAVEENWGSHALLWLAHSREDANLDTHGRRFILRAVMEEVGLCRGENEPALISFPPFPPPLVS